MGRHPSIGNDQSAVSIEGQEPVLKLLTIGDVWQEYAPVTLAQRVQAKLVGDLSSVHSIWQILLVGKHQQDSIAQLVLRPQPRHITAQTHGVPSLLVLPNP